MPELQKQSLPDGAATSDAALIQPRRWQRDGKRAIVHQAELRLLGGEDHRMDIEAWLQGLGLERYVPAFRDNEIDWEVLPKLTSDDLREIGVAAIGHRRKLLEAIAAIGATVPTALSAAPNAPPPADAERRQLTIVFCDLVGSTSLSTRYDLEDLREIVGIYHSCVADTVARFAGFIAKYMGDGVLVYFGYPQAHEDDAERAVRAGLAVIEAVGGLAAPEQLNVRLGIASGLVVVGDLIGEGAAQERGVVGETPNLAARLQALAQPGTLIIADSTRQQIGGLFDVEDLGPQPLAGFAEPQRVWCVVGESGVLSRFEALRSEATPLVGRYEELDFLLRRWQQAKIGEGRVVLLSGEPGIGKSRLAVELGGRIKSEPYTRLRYFCSPHHQDTALHPFIVQLERAAGFARDDTLKDKLDKLRELLAAGMQGDDEVQLLAELLSLPSTAAELNFSPQRKREKLFEALLHQLGALALHRPILMVFEDAHWADPTSRELLDLTIGRVARLPVLLAITFRPEFQHGWSGEPHVTPLSLNRLTGGDGVILVEQLAANAGLSRETIDEIAERADGVPLFVEELTKAVLETNERVLAVSASPELTIPSALHASLIARLDRLGPIAKEVAQVGSVIGREFGYDLADQVAQRSAPELRLGLDRLTEAGLLFCRGRAPQSTYLFKHALVQDAAYGTLLRARRQALHGRVAAALERHSADLVERQPELLAHHLTAAGDTERAVEQWLTAGRHAAERLAPLEAIRHFDRGLLALPALPKGPTRDRREIDLQLARGLSLFTTGGFASLQAAEAYNRARGLAEQQGDSRQQFMAIYGLWQSANGAGRIRDCRSVSRQLMQLTASKVDDELRLQAHHSAWATGMFAGEPVAAREHSEIGRRLYDPQRHRHHHQHYGGHDPGVCAGSIGAVVHWLLGYPEKGLAIGSEALALAEQLAHPFSVELGLLFHVMLRVDRGEPELALQRLEEAEALASEQRLGFVWEPRFLRGAALSAQGAFEETAACLREGLATRLGALTFRPYGLAGLAEAMVRQQEHEAALTAAKEGLEVQEKTGYGHWDSELHRLEGVALLGLNRLEEARSAFGQALRVARRQQAKAYELRTAMSLARLWDEQGRRAEARDLLAPIYGWFTEGFDTQDLKEAKALLDELA
jgi:class 3 adenylate cyclase/tetratricopeptide (TPR) repeat protein